ncbi:HNH endonuclease [Paenibacillus lemnae]|uniref:Putative HNH nuclease YajD n=1 Tax=Paenibacillus lemnae TaxID=1330551 RepID=A0A848M8S8_PAELE|nr:HNH endonuclease signature motif containing protein [Paenibacillus lemnae]NMO97457.1 HNH endonuclease [Paenibacillus lemnae]
MSEYDFNNERERKRFYGSASWLRLRQEVLKRDHNECIECAKEGKVTTREAAVLEIDHIQEIKDRPDLALDIDNLRTLCKYHHNVRHDRFDGRVQQEKVRRWDDEQW